METKTNHNLSWIFMGFFVVGACSLLWFGFRDAKGSTRSRQKLAEFQQLVSALPIPKGIKHTNNSELERSSLVSLTGYFSGNAPESDIAAHYSGEFKAKGWKFVEGRNTESTRILSFCRDNSGVAEVNYHPKAEQFSGTLYSIRFEWSANGKRCNGRT